MPRVSFTANLQRHTACEPCDVDAATVDQALASYFARFPRLRGYVLDDQGAVRHHMVIFVDGQPLRDRRGLSDPLNPDSQIFVFQALSGG